MTDELKEKIKKILMKEYLKHNKQVQQRHLSSGYFLNSWSLKMQKIGIKIFETTDSNAGYTVVNTGICMGFVHIPEETAEKIIILGFLP